MTLATTSDNLVWYAAYGSNMAAERLRCYLEGGCPPGGRRVHTGARNPAPPRASRALQIPYQLRFAGRSLVWGGGKAFVNPAVSGASSFARAWLLERDQFEDIWAQESGRDGHYDQVLRCGQIERVPVVTLTSPTTLTPQAPAVAYLRTIAQGLAQAHGLSVRTSARYLASAEGTTASAEQIAIMLSGTSADQQPDGPAAGDFFDPFDGEQFVTGTVDPPGERSW